MTFDFRAARLTMVESQVRTSDVTATGTVSVAARNESAINAAVIAASAAVGVGSTGVGASLGMAIVLNQITGIDANSPVQVLASIEDSDVAAGGALAVTATSQQSINALSFAGSVAIAAGSTGVALAGSGVGVTNDINVETSAFIDGQYAGASGVAISADSVAVQASNLSEINAYGGAASIAFAAGSTGVAVSIGASVVLNEIGGTTYAAITGTTRGVLASAGSILVAGSDTSVLKSTAQAASIAAGFGSTGIAISGAGAFSTNIITAAVASEVVGSDMTASAGVSVTASSTGRIKASVDR